MLRANILPIFRDFKYRAGFSAADFVIPYDSETSVGNFLQLDERG
jgi:hypothetical protein